MSLQVVYGLKHEIELLKRDSVCIPRMAVVHMTYNCNHKCTYCFFKKDMDGFVMSKQNFKMMVDQLSDLGVQSIELSGAGEPLSVPDVEELFQYIADKGMRIGLLTNGSLFTGHVAEMFLKHGTYVRFSLDSVNNETYKKIHGVDDCEVVKNNIDTAVLINQKNDYLCEISIKIGSHELLTIEEIQAIFDFCRGKRIHSVQLKNLWDKEGKYRNTSLSKTDVFRIVKNHNIRFVKKIGAKKRTNEQCWINPVQITIDAHGDFYLCYYYNTRKEKHKVGNIFQRPLKKLWGSKEHLEKIKAVKIYDCSKNDCRYMRYMDIAKHQFKIGDIFFT